MPNRSLNLSVRVSGSWLRLEQKFGEIEVSKYLDEYLKELGDMLFQALHAEYTSMMGTPYQGGLKDSIYQRRSGPRRLEVGLDLRRRAGTRRQNLYIYAMSQLKGWNPRELPVGVIVNRLTPWVRRTIGGNQRQARVIAFRIARSWAASGVKRPGRNFVAKVLQIPATGVGIAGTLVPPYTSLATELQRKALKSALNDLQV